MIPEHAVSTSKKNSLHTRRAMRALYLDTAMRLVMDASMIDGEDDDPDRVNGLLEEVGDKLEILTQMDVDWLNKKDGRL